ncbi:MAG: hypothetical protein QF830_09695 [Rhodospirillales bacterium]|nr:hypothetical protein [Rhodospirillales bacterium]
MSLDPRGRFSGHDKSNPDWALDCDSFTIEDVAKKTRAFLYEEHYQPLGIEAAPGVHFGFIVAGYSAGKQFSEVWQFQIVDGNCDEPQRLLARGQASVYAAGDPEVFSRLVVGYSQALGPALIKLGLPSENLNAALELIKNDINVPLVEPPMPIQDTIDLAEFFVYTTATFTRFKRGAPTVGGPIESAAITKHEGFKWVRRKHYYDTILNSGE